MSRRGKGELSPDLWHKDMMGSKIAKRMKHGSRRESHTLTQTTRSRKPPRVEEGAEERNERCDARKATDLLLLLLDD